MSFYTNLELAINTNNISTKKAYTLSCLDNCTKSEIDNSFKHVNSNDIKIFHTPSFAPICTIVEPKMLAARKNLDTQLGLGTLIHSIAHIEYSAIDLALDAVYRFRDMPNKYKIDWLTVALDEIKHFEMLIDLLNIVGYKYGDFPVHQGLFDVCMNTTTRVIERMAIVPRYFEASGLDVNPQIIKKLKNLKKEPIIQELISTLETILYEEIDHVHKGDRWFKYLCDKDGLAYDVYFDILEKYELLNKHRPHLNNKYRKDAGFSCEEIIKLGGADCE
jgi:uncharacterized ferritin-like protein (DUF455 family)